MRIVQELYPSKNYSLGLTVYYPDSDIYKKPRPAIVYVFGSGWHRGFPQNQHRLAESFCEEGYTVFIPDYSTATRYRSTPYDSTDDIVAVWEYIVKNAVTYQIDKDRLILSGASSGGQLCLMAALRSGIYPRGFILLYPALSDAILSKVGGEYYREISPNDIIANLPENQPFPPAAVFHGENDRVVECDASRKFSALLEKRGVECRLYTYPDCDHGFCHPTVVGNGRYFHDFMAKSLFFLHDIL